MIDGSLSNDVLDPGLIHIHGPTVFENSTGGMEVLGTVHFVGPVEKEVSCLVSHSCGAGVKSVIIIIIIIFFSKTCLPKTSADFFLSMIWMSHDPSGIWVMKE